MKEAAANPVPITTASTLGIFMFRLSVEDWGVRLWQPVPGLFAARALNLHAKTSGLGFRVVGFSGLGVWF